MAAKLRVAILWGFCVHYKPLYSYIIADFKLFSMTPMYRIVSMATNIGLKFCGVFYVHHKIINSYINADFKLFQSHKCTALYQWLPTQGCKFAGAFICFKSL